LPAPALSPPSDDVPCAQVQRPPTAVLQALCGGCENESWWPASASGRPLRTPEPAARRFGVAAAAFLGASLALPADSAALCVAGSALRAAAAAAFMTDLDSVSAYGPFPALSSGNLLRARVQHTSEPLLSHAVEEEPEHRRLRENGIIRLQQSEPSLFSASGGPDVDAGRFLTDEEYISASQLLENVVSESQSRRLKVITLPGGKQVVNLFENKDREYKERAYELVYGTMKYLGVIDTILVKTQFLVYNSQFLDSLCLVKVMLYELMRWNFDYSKRMGIRYVFKSSENPVQVVVDLAEALRRHQTKLAAAFARIRIEKHASGRNPKEQMENILPEDVRRKESAAVEMPKTMRVNTLKCSQEEVMAFLVDAGYPVQNAGVNVGSVGYDAPDPIKPDDGFDDLLEVSAKLAHQLKSSPLVAEGLLVPQDKASFFGAQQLAAKLRENPRLTIMEVGAASGTKTCHLAALMSNEGKIFAVEDRKARVLALKTKLKTCGVKSWSRPICWIAGSVHVEIFEENFLSLNPSDNRFRDVSVIVVEPPSSGTAIVDKLEYLLEEEEFPFEEYSGKDFEVLQRNQKRLLQHAFEFASVQCVVYITRSTKTEENEEIVSEALETSAFDLQAVLPGVHTNNKVHAGYDECLKLEPTTDANGIFIACFERIAEEDGAVSGDEVTGDLDQMALFGEQQQHRHRQHGTPRSAGHELDQPKKKKKSRPKVRRSSTKSHASLLRGSSKSLTRSRSGLRQQLSQAAADFSSLRAAPAASFERPAGRHAKGLNNDPARRRSLGGDLHKAEESKDDGKLSTDDDDESLLLDPAEHHERRARRLARKGGANHLEDYNIPLGIFGHTLKHFYSPRYTVQAARRDDGASPPAKPKKSLTRVLGFNGTRVGFGGAFDRLKFSTFAPCEQGGTLGMSDLDSVDALHCDRNVAVHVRSVTAQPIPPKSLRESHCGSQRPIRGSAGGLDRRENLNNCF
ncbi:MAG: S-adenosyl-L-methionine-dependent methyltransferase, partial [Olpidium bornovanus]